MSQGKRQKRSSPKSRNQKWGYIFLIPWLLFFLVFTVYPFAHGIIVSFTNSTIGKMEFIGLENYQAILNDRAFWRSLWATAKYAVIAIPIIIIVSLWVANALSTRGRTANTLTKSIFYLPSVICFSALILVWKFLVAPQSGYILYICQKLGIPPVSLLDQPSKAIPIMAFMLATVSFGQAIILYSAAINGIPASYHEAAMLDGATPRQRFFKITFPLLHPQTVFILVSTTIGTLQFFVIPYLMTGGGPQYRTSTVLLMIYYAAFQNGKFGYASAVGIVFFILTSIVAVIQFRITKRDMVEY